MTSKPSFPSKRASGACLSSTPCTHVLSLEGGCWGEAGLHAQGARDPDRSGEPAWGRPGAPEPGAAGLRALPGVRPRRPTQAPGGFRASGGARRSSEVGLRGHQKSFYDYFLGPTWGSNS